MTKKLLYNTQGIDSLGETLIGGNPSGLLNFNRTRYKWATSLYKTMRDCFWTPESVNTAAEARHYAKLSEEEKFAYDRVFAQLSFLDSLQADSLMDNLNAYITNKVVNACLIEQAAQEVLHSKSYAVLLADTVDDSDAVFSLYKSDLTLNAKNQAVADKYAELTTGEVTPEKIFYAMVANQLLEGVYFLSGFSTIYYLGDRMVASASMIAEIHKDENNHLALFQNMIREFIKENPDELWFRIRANVNNMFDQAYKIETSWMKYVLGFRFTDEVIESTVAYYCRKRARAIGMYDEVEDRFGHAKITPLVKALENRSNGNDTRTNFFEGKVTTYSKQELLFPDDMDYKVEVPSHDEHWNVDNTSYWDAVGKKDTTIDIEDRSNECVGCQ